MITIEQLNDYVQKVQESTGYWMVRTMGGDYYEEFDKEGFVAIGYNEITRHEINKLDADWNKTVYMDIFRNILAFGCTFYLIYFITSGVLNMLFVLTCGYATSVQKKAAIILGIIAASLLIPYYYYPA